MGSVAYSAYDPIFWSHHANIDRIWAEWQKANPDLSISGSILNTSMTQRGYDNTVRDTIDFEAMGFTDDTLENNIAAESFAMNVMESTAHSKKNIEVSGLKMTKETFEIQLVHKNNSKQNESNFLDSICLLSMKGGMNPHGFMGKFSRFFYLENVDNLDLDAITFIAFDENEDSVSLDEIAPEIEVKLVE